MGSGVVFLVLVALCTVAISSSDVEYRDEYESAPLSVDETFEVKPKYYHGFSSHHRRFSYHGIGGTSKQISYRVYLNRYHGFRLRHRRFTYRGRSYALRCRRNKFYSMWGHYYRKYHAVGRVFRCLLRKKLFAVYGRGGRYPSRRVTYSVYLNRYHGFRLRHRRFTYHGKSYVLRCRRRKFYGQWSHYYRKYHAVGPVFGRLLRKKLFVLHQGFRLKHGILGHFHRKIHAIGSIFHGLFKRRGYKGHIGTRYTSRRISYRVYLNRYHGFRLRHRRFTYRGRSYVLRCRRNKFYSLWGHFYRKYHAVGRVFRCLLRKKLFVVYGGGSGYMSRRISYRVYLNRYHGIRLRHRRFTYHGKSYALRCRRRKFYSLWGHFYRKYHAVGRVFRYLLRKKLFVVYGGGKELTIMVSPTECRVIRRKPCSDYTSRRISYSVYLNRYHGFRLLHRRFTYRGRSYVLRCRRRKFYSLWSRYYRKYHAVGRVFRSLLRKKLFVVYGGGSGYTSRRISYRVYLNRYHGFRLRHRRFTYRGRSYVLRCRRRKFYSLWSRYYRKYHAVGRVFKSLLRKKLFVVYGGGTGFTSRRISYRVYLNRYHGFRLRHRRFTYRGRSYVLRCRRRKFYSLWSRYYTKYHAVGRVFRSLLRKKLFVVYGGGSDYTSRRISYRVYLNRYHGFRLRHRRFTYRGRSYVLRCRRRKFYSLWSRYYRKYHAVGRVFRSLLRKKLFIVYRGGGRHISNRISYSVYLNRYHGLRLRRQRFTYRGRSYVLRCRRRKFYGLWSHYYRKYHAVGPVFGRLLRKKIFVVYHRGNSRINYVTYYKAHHGFKINGNRVFYNDGAYVLKVKRNKFYRIWYRYYNRYHSDRKIFNVLCRKRIIVPYDGEINYISYYTTHHGWKLNGKRFTYNGDEYILQTPRRRFYKLWYTFYRKYHDIDDIFGRLYDMHLFAPYNGAVVAGPDFGELDEYLDKHKMIADRNVARVNQAAIKHVRRITNVSNRHIKKINRQSNEHVSQINGEANKHINRFKQLVNHHIRKLEEKRKRHLNDVEKQHRRHMQQREIQHKRHVSVKHSVNTRHEKFIARAAAHFSDIDYLNTYHGFKIIDNRFNFDGTDFELKCSRERWYTKWCTCYEKEHNVNTCLDSLYNQGLVVTAGVGETPAKAYTMKVKTEIVQNDNAPPAEEREVVEEY